MTPPPPDYFSPDNPPTPISREALADGSLIRQFTAAVGQQNVLDEAERRARFEALLAGHAADTELWLFAYGSMLWNPTVQFVESRCVRVSGWHRSFCLRSTAGRGSAEKPGLMLGIEPGGECEGLAYRLAPEQVRSELHLLWQREMVTGAYQASWLPARCRAESELSLVAFVIDPAGSNYEGGLPVDEQARRIHAASGLLGSNLDYLLRTRFHLRRLGIQDDYIERLAAEVEQLSSHSPPNAK